MAYSEMDPARWQLIRPVLERAIELHGQDRVAFLDALQPPLRDLRDDIERMLAEYAGDEEDFFRRTDFVAVPALMKALQHCSDDDTGGADRLGERIGPYRLVKRLGSGGMGAVYLAEREDAGFAQRVAMKIVEGVGSSAAGRERFDREREIIARLRHAGIASLLDGGATAEGIPYYTMEFVEGCSIADYCTGNALTLEQRVRLLIEVASALAYAHQNLIVHRDIKPTNILLTADGRPKLLDFGIAKLLGNDADAGATRAAIGPMTPEYAAPEQFRGEAITVATDIFQFGTLCFRLLTGQWPYRADPRDAFGWSRAVNEDEPMTLGGALTPEHAETLIRGPASLRALRRRLSGDLDAIVRKALNKSPLRRYPSMDAMIVDLKSFLKGRPVRARRATSGYLLWRWMTRRPYVSAMTAIAIAALVTTTLIAVRQAGIARSEAKRSHREAVRADETSNFLISLFQDSGTNAQRDVGVEMSRLLERSMQRLEGQFGDRPEQRARLQISIGEIYATAGDWPHARAPLAAAVETLSGLRDADPVVLGHALRILGVATSQLKGSAEALHLFAQAEAVLQTANTADAREELAITYSCAAVASAVTGDDGSARSDFDAALLIAARESDGVYESNAPLHSNFGLLHAHLGESTEALREYEQAFAIFRRELGADHPRTLIAETDVGSALLQVGANEAALCVIGDVAERARRALGDASPSFKRAVELLDQIRVRKDQKE